MYTVEWLVLVKTGTATYRVKIPAVFLSKGSLSCQGGVTNNGQEGDFHQAQLVLLISAAVFKACSKLHFLLQNESTTSIREPKLHNR